MRIKPAQVAISFPPSHGGSWEMRVINAFKGQKLAGFNHYRSASVSANSLTINSLREAGDVFPPARGYSREASCSFVHVKSALSFF
jgi:hypothetical protein